MLQHRIEIATKTDPYPVDDAVISFEMDNERRATGRAGVAWRGACAGETLPHLSGFRTSDEAPEWHDRFLIRGDTDMSYAVFLTCGETLQSDWDIERQGGTLEETLPGELCDAFADACNDAMKNARPVPMEGSYQDDDNREVLFRCVAMPVRDLTDEISLIYGAYSQKFAR